MKSYQFLTNVAYNGMNYAVGTTHELSDGDAANLASEIRLVSVSTVEPVEIQEVPVKADKEVTSAPNKMQKKRKKK